MDNLQIEKISQLPRNDSLLGANDDFIVNREVSPGVYKTRRGKFSDIFPPATATTFDRQSDFQDPYQYCGFAPSGSSINDPVWFITRLTVNLNGTELTQTASNVAWSNRTSVIYT